MKLINKKRDPKKEEEIIKIVCLYTGISEERINGKLRLTPVKIARQIAQYYIYQFTNDVEAASFSTNQSDRTSAYNSIKRVRTWSNYPDYNIPMQLIEIELMKRDILKEPTINYRDDVIIEKEIPDPALLIEYNMIKNDYNCSQMADLLEISKSHMSNILNGKVRMSEKMYNKIINFDYDNIPRIHRQN